MGDLAREMGRLRARVAPSWSDTRQKAVERSLLRKQEHRQRAWQLCRVMAAASLAAVVAFLVPWRPAFMPSAGRMSAPVVPWMLADGSSITPDPGADVSWVEVSPMRVTAVLKAGRARFNVAHREDRLFRVEGGAIAVQVLGTSFTVERANAGRSLVAVERGRVRVVWTGGSRDLSTGQSGVFPPEDELREAGPPPAPTSPSDPSAVAEASSVGAHLVPPASPTWRSLAEGGSFDEAYEALKREGGPSVVRDEVNDLLLVSDIARLSQHPREAVDPLRQILRLHADDPRASLAAFTLGRVLLESLGRPHEAAEAFARSRALAPSGELVSDALAREVEARAAMGDTDFARTLALEYVRDYPDGPRLRSVRRFGRLQ